MIKILTNGSSTLLILAVCKTTVSHMNLIIKWPSSPRVSRSSQCPTGIWEAMGLISNSVRTQIFSLSHAHDKYSHFIFIIYVASLITFTTSIMYYTYDVFDIADPSSMQDVCHIL